MISRSLARISSFRKRQDRGSTPSVSKPTSQPEECEKDPLVGRGEEREEPLVGRGEEHDLEEPLVGRGEEREEPLVGRGEEHDLEEPLVGLGEEHDLEEPLVGRGEEREEPLVGRDEEHDLTPHSVWNDEVPSQAAKKEAGAPRESHSTAAWLVPAVTLCALAASVGCLAMRSLGVWPSVRPVEGTVTPPSWVVWPFAQPAEATGTSSEWEVVYEGEVNITKRNNLSSKVVGVVAAGTVVLGVEEGKWLRLSGLDGYIMQACPGGEVLRRREVSYLMVDGSCGDEDAHDIPDQTICRHAARRLEQAEEAIWYKDGCQVDLAKTRAASSQDVHRSSANASEEEDDDYEDDEENKTTEEEGEDALEEDDGPAAPVAAQEDEEAAENAPPAGRRLRRGACHGRRCNVISMEFGHRSSPPSGQSIEEFLSWKEYSKAFKRICSTAPYEADRLMAVPTHTSVTSVTLTTLTTVTLTTTSFPLSLFCFAMFQANSAEQDLVKEACKLRAGIFACDTTVTLSREKVWVGKDRRDRDVWSWVSSTDDVGKGDVNNEWQTTSSWLNTQNFINAINILVGSDLIWEHDWTVKADPDAVIFPDRVRTHVIASGATGTAAFYENCFNEDRWKLYGAIEIFSKEAMERYRDAGQQECEWGEDWKGWGEDTYMDVCMHKLGAAAIQSSDLVRDNYCVGEEWDCSDDGPAAFHFFKTADAWRQCLEGSPPS